MTTKKQGAGSLPEVNIGLVGHVDHGKTTLAQALSERWTSTHSEEMKRGITIRLGYADFTIYHCPKCPDPQAYSNQPVCPNCGSEAKPLRTLSIVDAPGHETLMTTMISGAALMNGAILVISAVDPCPQPQTREHLTALGIMQLDKVIVVQNKIDLVSPERARQSYKEIKAFLAGSAAENAPIIPISAQRRINIDALLQAIQEHIPTPNPDPSKPPRMLIARSFDVNRPGTEISKLAGGVLGGGLIAGELKVGEEVDIRPGVKIKEKYQPLTTTIRAIQKGGQQLEKAGPGGLLGISTGLDPSLTRSDTLAGNILARKGTLPEPTTTVSLVPHLLPRVIGAKEDLKVDPIKAGEPLLLTAGISRTVGAVTQAAGGKVSVTLRIPVIAEKGDRTAIARQIGGRWRLIGWGEIV